jgi:hypothetical protein
LVLGVPVFALGGVWPFLSFLLPFCLLPFLSGGGGMRKGNNGGRVREKTIGHGVGVGVEPKARGGGKNC